MFRHMMPPEMTKVYFRYYVKNMAASCYQMKHGFVPDGQMMVKIIQYGRFERGINRVINIRVYI